MSCKTSNEKNLTTLLLAMGVLFSYSCSDDQIVEPQFEDLKTSANAYADQFLTIKITTTPEDLKMRFTLAGNGGKVFVDWGDGTKQQRILDWDNDVFQHAYREAKDFTIKVSGEIKAIENFLVLSENLRINSMHLGGLTNLEVFSFQIVKNSPATINLSQCRKLSLIELSSVPNLTDVILPATNEIAYADFYGATGLSTAVVDRTIARIHDSVVASPREGVLNLTRLYISGHENEMIGPPSSYSLNKLRKLRDVYGWYIYPEAALN